MALLLIGYLTMPNGGGSKFELDVREEEASASSG
jgi:hypothetical protein